MGRWFVALEMLALLSLLSCANSRQELVQQHLDAAQTAANRQDYSLAAAELGEAIQIYPDEQLYELQGDAYQASGNLGGAINDYTYLIQNYDPSAEYYGQRSVLYAQSGDFLAGLADAQEMVRIAPNSYTSYMARGFQYEMLDRYDDAIGDFSHAIGLAPDHASPYLQRGFAYGLMGEYQRAEADFQQALKRDRELPIAYAALAWLRATCPVAGLRNGKQALSDALRACSLDKWSDPLPLAALAAAHAENGDFASAVMWQEYAIAKTLSGAAPLREQEQRVLAVYRSGKPYHSDFSAVKPALVWIPVPV
ncbi:MAG TPA: hypothetical protein VEJ86_00540 [Candidatus Binataceae bacterium]|nr:hypothetical protein [Candidatus Binataceae bacterium]